MKKNPISIFVILIFLCSCLSFAVPIAVGSETYQQPTTNLLDQGISQYREENYEEAIEILTKARQQDK
ncbi:MAG TPA: hypothetical protein PLU95_09110, partial [Syntrophales bacterium]|nr:hypothetical protein [Syntrophales bacterium]HOD98471.1 hypothetical protein [Syntrophales bacterium]HPN09446.1 hypothetical protein [Syntrophales bacterium]HPX81794.1 hypothetical protein [Syntrophales bacterium]HQB13990.1 hypothetical protein [Syntrophales bacterium]